MKKNNLKYGINSSLFIIVILGFIVIANYLSNQWFSRLDLTEGKQYTITESTIKTIENLDDIVNIKVFFSKKLPSQMLSVTKNVKDILGEYRAYSKGNLKITYLDPSSDKKIEQEANSLGLRPVRMDAIEKDQRQIMTGYLGIVIQYLDKKELLPLVTDVEDLEYKLTSAIKKVIRNEDIKIGVLVGNKETSLDTTCSIVRDNLKQRFTLVNVITKEGNPIDSTLKALIVMSPLYTPDRTKFEIDQYIMKGGKVLFLIDGVSIESNFGLRAKDRAHHLNDMLSNYGARIGQNLVLDPACGVAQFQTQVGPGFYSYFTTPYPLWVKFGKEGLNKDLPAVNKLSGLMLPWTSEVEITLDSADTSKNVKAIVLARSTKKSWTMQGNYKLDPQGKFNAPDGLRKSYPLVVSLQGKFKSFYSDKKIPKFSKKLYLDDGGTKVVDTLRKGDEKRIIVKKSPFTRILVVGNSRLATNQFVQQTGGINLNFMQNIVDWMALDDDLITIRSRSIIDRPLKVTTPAQRNIIRWANLLIMPLLFAIFGITRMIIRRKKHQGGK